MQEINDAISQIWVYFLSALGGIVGYGQDFKLEDGITIQCLKIANRIVAAIFTGLITLILCKALGLSLLWTFPIVGIFAWRGVRGLQALADWIDKKFFPNDGGGLGK